MHADMTMCFVISSRHVYSFQYNEYVQCRRVSGVYDTLEEIKRTVLQPIATVLFVAASHTFTAHVPSNLVYLPAAAAAGDVSSQL